MTVPDLTLPLRPYQQAAYDAVLSDWAVGTTRVAVVHPTGAGKTVLFTHLVHDHKAMRPLILVHREELVDQTLDTLRAVAPALSVGVVKAERDEAEDRDVVIASVQTMARPHRRDVVKDVHRPGLIVVDEGHHAAADTWRATLKTFGAFDGVPTVGFSATLGRNDNKSLGAIWQRISHRMDILEAIGQGWLVDVKAKQVRVDGLDLTTAQRSRGDFTDTSLSELIETPETLALVAQTYAREASDRPGILFAPSVAGAYAFAEALMAEGIGASVVSGATPSHERRATYAAHRRGDLQVICSCMVLTEGFDAPWASCAIIARPTLSDLLFTQMCGRILRPFPGKHDALVLDVAGVAGNLNLATVADLTSEPIQVTDGETLTEAYARAKREAGVLNGRFTLKDIDLFQRSRSVWLQSSGGVYFLPAGKQIVFLADRPGGRAGWAIGLKTATGGEWLCCGYADLDLAMAVAEQQAKDDAGALNDQRARWRKAPMSTAQRVMLERYGRNTHGMTKGQASDAISVALSSPWLDQYFAEKKR